MKIMVCLVNRDAWPFPRFVGRSGHGRLVLEIGDLLGGDDAVGACASEPVTVQESDQAHTKRECDERSSKQHPSPSHATPSRRRTTHLTCPARRVSDTSRKADMRAGSGCMFVVHQSWRLGYPRKRSRGEAFRSGEARPLAADWPLRAER